MTDPDRPAHAGMPAWVKAFIVLGVLLAVFFIVQVMTGGEHGPGRHGG